MTGSHSTSASRGGCRIKTPGELAGSVLRVGSKRPSRPSRAGRPSRGRRTRLLWRARPRTRSGASETALCEQPHGEAALSPDLQRLALSRYARARTQAEVGRWCPRRISSRRPPRELF